MADGKPRQTLPIGWIEKVEVKDGDEVKYYYNRITGQTRYSKTDIPGYDAFVSSFLGMNQPKHAQNEKIPENESMQPAAKSNNAPDWLPRGWNVEVNSTSKGTKYKRYIDPSTGRKFSSKPEILRYLNSNEGNEPASNQTATTVETKKNPPVVEPSAAETPQKSEEPPALKATCSKSSQKETSGKSSQEEKSSSGSKQKKVEVVRSPVEGLPPGWIKEIKIEKIGSKIRKDPYFTDPVSRYVFRSHPDALRYVETKDPKVCAIKPKKREDLKFLSDDIPVLEEQQSLGKTTEEGTEKKESNTPTSVQPPTTGSKRKRGRPVAAPSANNTTQKSADVINSTKFEG